MKNIYHKFRQFTEKAIYNDRILLVLSVFLAIFVWGYITNREYRDSGKILKNVAIDYEASLAGTPAGEEGYRIYDPDINSVDIWVAANRTKLAYIDKDMFYIKASADNYTGEQPVTVNLQLFKSDTNDFDCDYSLEGVKKAKVYFYKEITKTIENPSINAPDITASDGYKLKSISCDSVSVTGPEPYVNMIQGCTLNLNQNVSYDSRQSLTVEASLSTITFTDENGESLNDILRPYLEKDQFRINKDKLSVLINISMVKNLGITDYLVDVPDNFDKNFILDRMTLSPDSVTVSSDDQSILQDMVTLPVASDDTISLNSIDMDFTASFDIAKALELYPKLSNDSNIAACYVTFDSTGLEEKVFESISNENSHFRIKNPYSSKYSVEIITQRLSNVKIIGPASQISKLTADDLTVEIDISKSSVSDTGKINTGISTYKAVILPPKEFKNVWICGNDYPIDVNITEIPEETEPVSYQQYPSAFDSSNVSGNE